MFLLVRIRAPGRRLSTLPQRLDSIAFNPNRMWVKHSLVVSGGGGGRKLSHVSVLTCLLVEF